MYFREFFRQVHIAGLQSFAAGSTLISYDHHRGTRDWESVGLLLENLGVRQVNDLTDNAENRSRTRNELVSWRPVDLPLSSLPALPPRDRCRRL